MKVLFQNRALFLLVVLGHLLAGCRSEKVAFSFRPPASTGAGTLHEPIGTPPAAVTAVPDRALITAAPVVTTAPVPQANAFRKPNTRGALRQALALRPALRQAKQATQSVRAWQAHRPNKPADNESDVLHAVLGALLIIGGVILGLLIGGWLGLGIGAAVVILGYYFLVLSFGGPHAWLEIFQEFFNM